VPGELTIKIAGEAGQGMQSVGTALGQVFRQAGLNIFATQDFMSRIRGGNNFFQISISSTPLLAPRQKCDILVALDKGSIPLHRATLTARGKLIMDQKKFGITEAAENYFDVPYYDLAEKIGGGELFINSVASGVLAGITRLKFDFVRQALKKIFNNKSQEIIDKNLAAAKAGYDFAVGNYKTEEFAVKQLPIQESLVMNGHDALALGAIRAGCKFYSAYPMSPSTSIMENLASLGRDFGIVVEQAEDEIAAINMVIGASYTGVRSMAATAGGGFALMVEGFSLAGMLETPIVIVDAQRPAPATGFPTRTEQADLEFLIHAGHGEFARAIFAPGTIEQAFYLTVKAFNLAEKYQIPVLIMTDQYLADSYRNVEKFDLGQAMVKRYRLSKEESTKITNYKRYQLTDTGVSPLAVPSWINDVVYADSDEHTEEGHITEDGEIRKQMVAKRLFKKMAGLSAEIEKPEVFNVAGAEVVMIGFGSTYGVIKEAAEALVQKRIGFIHLSQVWPFPGKAMEVLLKDVKKVVTVENNASAQLANVLRRETGIKVTRSILKYDGRPFDLDELITALQKES